MLVVVISFSAVGCSSSVNVRPENNEKEKAIGYEKMTAIVNENIFGPTTVVLVNGGLLSVSKIFIGKDTTYFFDRDHHLERKILTADIHSIRRVDRVSGVYEGLFFGALIGGGAGFGTGLIMSSFTHDSENDGMGAALGGLGGLMLGGTIGFFPGIISGHTYTYEFLRGSVSVSEPRQ